MASDHLDAVQELARRCAEESARYHRGPDFDPTWCYELFRRAIVERDEQAWAAVYNQYHRLVRHWLGNAPEDAEGLVDRVFEVFWRALPPSRFTDFYMLDRILAYLKRCAQSVAIDATRQQEREKVKQKALAQHQQVDRAAGTRPSSDQALQAIATEQLFEYVMRCLNSSQEKLVIRASFEWDLSPKEIAARWPHLFGDAKEVSRVKERIFRRLQRDEGLTAFRT